MNEKTTKTLSKLKLIGLILYFIILFFERLLAVILSFGVGGEYALISGNVFNYIAYGITAVSLVAGLILMIKVMPAMFVSVFTSKEYDFASNYKQVVIAAMAILFGGMMHTGFTIAPVQFVAYGFLIASMVVRTIECCRDVELRVASGEKVGAAADGKSGMEADEESGVASANAGPAPPFFTGMLQMLRKCYERVNAGPDSFTNVTDVTKRMRGLKDQTRYGYHRKTFRVCCANCAIRSKRT